MSIYYPHNPEVNETIYWDLETAIEHGKNLQEWELKVGKGMFIVVDNSNKKATQ